LFVILDVILSIVASSFFAAALLTLKNTWDRCITGMSAIFSPVSNSGTEEGVCLIFWFRASVFLIFMLIFMFVASGVVAISYRLLTALLGTDPLALPGWPPFLEGLKVAAATLVIASPLVLLAMTRRVNQMKGAKHIWAIAIALTAGGVGLLIFASTLPSASLTESLRGSGVVALVVYALIYASFGIDLAARKIAVSRFGIWFARKWRGICPHLKVQRPTADA